MRFKDRKIVIKDINGATQEELKKVYGIGPALSGRIIKERERLKSFIDISQVGDIYGLTDSTMIQLKKHFFVSAPLAFHKIALNTATEEELLFLSLYPSDVLYQLRSV
mgnify:CR=1 FL=1